MQCIQEMGKKKPSPSGWSQHSRCGVVDEVREVTQEYLFIFILRAVRHCLRSFTWRVVCTDIHFKKTTEGAV